MLMRHARCGGNAAAREQLSCVHPPLSLLSAESGLAHMDKYHTIRLLSPLVRTNHAYGTGMDDGKSGDTHD